MKLSMNLKKRWIISVLREAEATEHQMPWHRSKRRATRMTRTPSTTVQMRIVRA